MGQVKRSKRVFSPEQKADMLNRIETDIKGGLAATQTVEKQGIAYSMYNKWKRQLDRRQYQV